MPNILIRDVPADIHAELQRRAERDGRSLQQYLLIELKHITDLPTMDELLDRIENQTGGRVGLGQAAIDLSEDRAAH
jgi:plasmid stability protein